MPGRFVILKTPRWLTKELISQLGDGLEDTKLGGYTPGQT
jgi:hypothetical protein